MIFTSGTQALQGRTVNHEQIAAWMTDGAMILRDNPILAAYRAEVLDGSHDLDSWLWSFASYDAFGGHIEWDSPESRFHLLAIATPEQIEHARAVLTRLAALGLS